MKRRGKGRLNIHWMESERVHRPNMVHVVNSLPVALEGVLLVLDLRAGIEVFNCNSALDGCRSIT